MRERFKITSTVHQKVAYVYKDDVWCYCKSCLETRGHRNKLFKVKKSAGSIIEIRCHRCGKDITIEI